MVHETDHTSDNVEHMANIVRHMGNFVSDVGNQVSDIGNDVCKSSKPAEMPVNRCFSLKTGLNADRRDSIVDLHEGLAPYRVAPRAKGGSVECAGRAERRRRFRAHENATSSGNFPPVRKRCRATLATALQNVAPETSYSSYSHGQPLSYPRF